MDFAKRAYDKTFSLDPIVRSLLDTDFYKLLMAQFIFVYYPFMQVTFKLMNRSKTIKLGKILNIDELRAQLDHVLGLRFTSNELIWLTGNTFYGVRGIFKPEFIEALRNLQLSPYELKVNQDDEFELTFSGNWLQVTLWEIYAMVIVNTLRNRAGMRQMSKFDLKRLYNEAEHRLFTKLDYMAVNDVTGLADFGTRRRHDFLWQEFCVEACLEILSSGFIGTSNAYLAMKHGLEAIGTNAHELPMALACLADTDEQLIASQYRVLEQWKELYGGNLLVMLPDTFGSTQFFKNAPDWVADFLGIRLDSKNPFIGGDEGIEFFRSRGRDPMTKLLLPSDGLDERVIVDLKKHFEGRIGRLGFGLGTNLTNDYPPPIQHFSLVCKLHMANGRSAVKLSDNKDKRCGDPKEVARYVNAFGEDGMQSMVLDT